MGVSIDEARHQGPSGTIDDDGVIGAVCRNRLKRNFLDDISPYQDMRRAGQLRTFPGEDPNVLEERGSWRFQRSHRCRLRSARHIVCSAVREPGYYESYCEDTVSEDKPHGPSRWHHGEEQIPSWPPMITMRTAS